MALTSMGEGNGWQSVGPFHAIRMDPVAGVHRDTLKERVGRGFGLVFRWVTYAVLGSAAAGLVALTVMAFLK